MLGQTTLPSQISSLAILQLELLEEDFALYRLICDCYPLQCYTRYILVRFQVLAAESMKIFWDVAPCSLVEVYRRFRGACCLHHQVWGVRISADRKVFDLRDPHSPPAWPSLSDLILNRLFAYRTSFLQSADKSVNPLWWQLREEGKLSVVKVVINSKVRSSASLAIYSPQ
jgi:hypothetical protein